MRELKREEGGWSVSMSGSGGGEHLTVLMSVEDARGKWLGDLQTWRLSSSGSIGSSGSGWTLKEGVPARFVVLRAKGEDLVKVPFTITGIRPN